MDSSPQPPPARRLRAALRSDESYTLVRWLFLRGLGLSYLVAFLSLWVQIEGLIGPEGILPAESALANIEARFGAERFTLLPTLFWLTGAGSSALHATCAAGTLAALALVVGWATGPSAAIAWAAYLSLVGVGQHFLSFQWDSLLLETGFAALLLAPWHLGFESVVSPRARGDAPSRLAVWVLRFLLFKLMFLSGWVKLAGGDPTWRDLSAMSFHHLTTCLPTWMAWAAFKLPDFVHRASTAMALTIELALPLLIVFGRRGRLMACVGFAALQLGIASTGNYGFFNLLTLTLCVTWLDDRALLASVPARWRARLRVDDVPGASSSSGRAGDGVRLVVPALAAVLLLASVSRMWISMGGGLPGSLRTALHAAARVHAVNAYGLFAVMTTTRPEIVLEGSNDGSEWREYHFRWKPGDVAQRPRFAALHMPRLDWQMWFAALSSPQRQSWFPHFMRAVHAGSPRVLALLADDPFPAAPPRYLRAVLFDYRFSDLEAWRRTGDWWERERLRLYFGPLERP